MNNQWEHDRYSLRSAQQTDYPARTSPLKIIYLKKALKFHPPTHLESEITQAFKCMASFSHRLALLWNCAFLKGGDAQQSVWVPI